MPNFLAVDLGASNGRVLLANWDGGRFTLRELHRFSNGPSHVLGRMHWNVLGLFAEIKTGLNRYAAEFDEPPAGIGVDTWGVDYALLDGAGQLLGNPVHYRDARTNGVPDLLFQVVPADEVFRVTGIQFMQLNTLYQLYSMVLAHDPQLAAARTFVMMPDLFHYWLTGRKTVEYTIASTTQMLDCRRRVWSTELLEQLGIPSGMLPEITPAGTILGPVRPDVRAETGLPGAPPVIATGSHDTASAVAAVPDLDQDSAYLSSGTWSLMGVETSEPVINERALALNFTNEGGVGKTIRLLKNITGLWLLQESRRMWRTEGVEPSWDDLLGQAEQASPFRSMVDPDAPDFHNPGDMPAAIRAYCRRSGQPEPVSVGEVVRCCLESLALKYRLVFELLESLVGRELRTIRIVGGGCRNRLLCRFTAEACRRPVAAGPVEATALGNVMLQAIAAGHLPDMAGGRRAIGASVERDYYEPSRADEWEAPYARFRSIIAR
jgi:rhamnulokinase